VTSILASRIIDLTLTTSTSFIGTGGHGHTFPVQVCHSEWSSSVLTHV
jgi:hypothetical protein